LDALIKAYSSWPVVVVEGAADTGDRWAIVKAISPSGWSCGDTNIIPAVPKESIVGYDCTMGQAQWALQVVINNAQDEVNALKRQDLIQAIGRGIGNNAAHEFAHQFLSKCCGMDVLISQDPGVAGTYNNGSQYGDPDPNDINSDPAPYTGYGKNGKAIFWQDITKQALGSCLGKGWQNYFSISSCH